MIFSALNARPTSMVRCDRQRTHAVHEYVATPTSPVILTCPGLRTTRSLSQLLTERPDLVEMLCFVAECHRSGATAAELNLTFDQAVDIEDFPRTDDREAVSCPDCREWINA